MKLLTTAEVAEQLGVKATTLEKWRIYSRGPVFCRIGTRIKYHPADVEAWLDKRRAQSTAEA